MMYDVVIIGGGPAAVAAGIYAARKKLAVALVADSVGGQSLVSAGIENWIGTVSVSGVAFAKMLDEHLRAQENIVIKVPEHATAVRKDADHFVVETDKGVHQAKAVIVASGGHHRHLNVPGEDAFNGKGVAYCATCDAPLFRGKTVAVVGGGNSGLEAVIDLLPYAKEIYLIALDGSLRGDPVTQEKVKNSPLVTVIYEAETKEILGNVFVEGLRYTDRKGGEDKTIAVSGVFVEVGSAPNSDFVRDLVTCNAYGEIVIDHRTCATSVRGIFAAGDVTDAPYKQNNIAAGDGIKALLSAYDYVTKERGSA